jgi:6-phosphogluconolactonase
MSRTIGNVRVFAHPAALAAAGAEEFFARALRAHANGQTFTCALSGGHTPVYLFSAMTAPETLARLPAGFWSYVHFFWADERNVPADHSESNYRSAREFLLDKIGIPEENIHPIRPDSGSACLAADKYENEFKRFFTLLPGQTPRLDLVFLGMGEDGHVASLFPHSEALKERASLVTSAWVAKLDSYRITLTLPVLNNAACIIFMIQGSEKAETLRRVLAEPPQPDLLPAQSIQPSNGELMWLLDRTAAARLDGLSTE